MFLRLFLDLAVAVVVGGHPGPAPSGAMITDTPRAVAPAPLVRGAGAVRGGPRPPKKPPEKRPHDSSWSEIKTRLGGRP